MEKIFLREAHSIKSEKTGYNYSNKYFDDNIYDDAMELREIAR